MTGRLLICLLLGVGALLLGASPAGAAIAPPQTVDGPSSTILGFGGAAIADDGSGGLVYLKSVGGVPHAFASRYVGSHWSAPIRVDWDKPYEAREPRLAAGPKGELMVVWVSELATVHGQIQYALFSATLGPGANQFRPSLLVDPELGEGTGVAPAVAATAPGRAIVAYRVITYNFSGNKFSTAVQLRPGDVMADIRVARLTGERWSRLGAVNRNPEASMRPPALGNGPQVALGNDNKGAVAWQEPNQGGVAQVWVRRVFGTTLGPPIEATPTTWQGKPVTVDATSFALAMTALSQGRLAVQFGPGSSVLAGRQLLYTLPGYHPVATKLAAGAQLVGAAPSTAVGMPGVAANDKGAAEGAVRLAYLEGSSLQMFGAGAENSLVASPAGAAPRGEPGAQVFTTVDPAGGGAVVYPTSGSGAVAVLQELPGGALQAGTISGAQSGPVFELALGSSLNGDALLGFRQGEPGYAEIVGDRISTPPQEFELNAPSGWRKPGDVKLSWHAAESAGGDVTYSVLVDGTPIRTGLRRLRFMPPPGSLGNGTAQVRIAATDTFGGSVLTKPARVRVDGQPPTIAVRAAKRRPTVRVKVADPDSGVRKAATRVSFGDGGKARRGVGFKHVYAHRGTYRVTVSARDRVGNAVRRSFKVKVR